ncbi:MAG: hypothetical protein ACI9VS_000885 [Candidatus Binatia bacterium]|jgi:hypothetical protein
MQHELRLHIPINSSILCLAYKGVAKRLVDTFPQAVLSGWLEPGEYQRLEAFLEGSEDISGERKSLMLAQTRTKQISNGPSCAFSFPASDGSPAIDGTFRPWDINFRRESPFSEHDAKRITDFLNSFGIGTLESRIAKNDPEAE